MINSDLNDSMVVHLDRFHGPAAFRAQTPISSEPAETSERTYGGETCDTVSLTQPGI